MNWQQNVFSTLIIEEGIPGSGVFGYSPVPGYGNLILSETATPGKDDYGNAYLAGVTLYSDLTGVYFAFSIFGSGFINSPIGFAVWTSATAAGPYTEQAFFNIAGVGSGFGWVSSPVFGIQPEAVSGFPGVPDPWNYVGSGGGQPAFATGWSNFGSGNADLAFRMLASPPRSVWVNGVVTPSGAAGDPLFTVPASYAPASGQPLSGVNATTSAACTWFIGPGGAVTFRGTLTSGQEYVINDVYSLDI